MYKTILVPLDGSKRAEAILPHVEKLAVKYNAKIVLLQVAMRLLPVEGTVPDHHLQNIYETNTEAVEDYLEEVIVRLRKKEIDAKKYVCHGPVVETIINIAEKENADLIAIASHGRSGLSRVFYGSVAAGLLNSIDRPLLLIRSRSHA